MRRLADFLLPPAAALLCLSACTTVHEAAGDKALDEGRATDAIAAYTRALSDTPILDYDFERIRDKRKRIIEGEWGPKLDALEATQPTTAPVEYATRLIEFRRGARNAATTQAFARRIDAVLTAAVEGDRLVVTDPTRSARHVSTLLDLFAFARRNAVPLAVTDGIAAAVAKTASVPWPAVAANEGLQRLELLLRYKATARGQQLPASVDGALDARLSALDGAPFPPATREEIDARFGLSLKLRADVRSLGAPPEAVALADRVHEDALSLLLEILDEEAAARRYLGAVERVTPFVAQVDSAHPLRARLTRLLQEGAAWHRTHATSLPAGYRRALHHALAFSLGGAEADRQASRAGLDALSADWKTSLQLAPRFALGAGCGGQEKSVALTLSKGGRPVVVRIRLGRCQASTSQRRRQQVANYVAEEKYWATEKVLVSYRYERVKVGSHKEQCTRQSSLDGYVWKGVCDVPDYETRKIEEYEDRRVERVREASGNLHYTVHTRRLVATMSGEAALEWEDGTTLTVPVQVSVPLEEEAWDYTLPPRRLNQAPRRHAQPFSRTTEATLLDRAALDFGQQASNALHDAVRAHRARLARKAGAATADEAQRAEAFIRSVLLDSRTEAEAAGWFARTHHLEAPVANALLLDPRARAVPSAAPAPVVSGPWAPAPLPVLSDGFERTTNRLERDLDVATAITYGDGILPPNEYVAFHMGLAPLDVHAGSGLTTRPAFSIALDLAYGLLEYFSPRYGLVFHDEAGLDLAMGLRLGGVDRVDYDDDTEGGSSFRFEASYALFGGLRTPWFGVFAGATAGYAYAFSGDTVARGGHLEPAVRLGLRFWRTTQLLLEASGFTPLVPGVAHRDRLAVSFPLSGRHGMDLRLSWERTTLPTRALASDGETDVEVAPHALQVVGVQLGMRF